MGPTQTFIGLIGVVNRDNVLDVNGLLGALIAAEDRADPRRVAMRRHLEALAFRLEGDGQLGAAATYDLISAVITSDRERWLRAAAARRLRDLCGSDWFDEDSLYAARLQTEGDAPALIQDGIAALLKLRWASECRGAAEACVQCCRLAFGLNGGANGIAAAGSDPVSANLNKLRRLQFDALLEGGNFAEAIALDDQTRQVSASGPFVTYDVVITGALAAAGGATYTKLVPPHRIPAPEICFTQAVPTPHLGAGRPRHPRRQARLRLGRASPSHGTSWCRAASTRIKCS